MSKLNWTFHIILMFALITATSFIGWELIVSTASEKQSKTEIQEIRLKQDFEAKLNKAIHLDIYRQQKEYIELILSDQLRSLSRYEQAEDIQPWCKQLSQLINSEVNCVYKKQVIKDFYKEHIVNLDTQIHNKKLNSLLNALSSNVQLNTEISSDLTAENMNGLLSQEHFNSESIF